MPCRSHPDTNPALPAKAPLDAAGGSDMGADGLADPLFQHRLPRKNALFAGHDEGGCTWGRIASLIETAKINNVEPFAYLKATLEAIAGLHQQSRISELLPWNFAAKV
ncbi:hypothetical protein AK812_SmicGene43998 [Symbiodinium microadriaticum]|uniref:Transposase IS66 C-terminal domain-containing protein n=1 Tax=Symbiodinium microadriaticum TaxID=2951 RepID=A0A1Q9BZK9_SYMMI|nr:hypothetical protein AK812_SmicGene43998 [Symbiodinium microadriaticum]